MIDRQKGTRILKRLKKELNALEDESKRTKLQQQVHNAEVDVNYAIYYPLMKPYSSLYPKSKKGKTDDSEDAEDTGEDSKNSADQDGPKGDVEMWRAVEQAMEDGTLEKLRYSKDSLPAEPPKKTKKPKIKEAKKDKMEKKSHAIEQEEEDSDNGFFE